METVAVYSESKIRTYGFDLQQGLNLMEMDLSDDNIHQWGNTLSGAPWEGCRFEWMVAWTDQGPSTKFWLLCDDANARICAHHLKGAAADPMDFVLNSAVRVDVIRFQGPHFGDRFGVADYTLTALVRHGIDFMGMTCSISGISLVLPRGRGQTATTVLRSVFEIPQKTSSKGRCTGKNQRRSHE